MLKNLTYGNSLFFLLLPIWARADLNHLCLRSRGHWAKIKIYKHKLENRHCKDWSTIRRKAVRWKAFCNSNDCCHLLSSLLVNTLSATSVAQKLLLKSKHFSRTVWKILKAVSLTEGQKNPRKLENYSLQSYRKYTGTQQNIPLHFHVLTEVVQLKLQMFDRFSA